MTLATVRIAHCLFLLEATLHCSSHCGSPWCLNGRFEVGHAKHKIVRRPNPFVLRFELFSLVKSFSGCLSNLFLDWVAGCNRYLTSKYGAARVNQLFCEIQLVITRNLPTHIPQTSTTRHSHSPLTPHHPDHPVGIWLVVTLRVRWEIHGRRS